MIDLIELQKFEKRYFTDKNPNIEHSLQHYQNIIHLDLSKFL